MPLWTSQEIEAALSLTISSSWQATGISIDTRTLEPGDLYIAIQGDTFDGHQFVEEAFARGAVAALVAHPVNVRERLPQIIVQDTLKALFLLGEFARNRTKATIIAVTGSVGKTTTKELLSHTLRAYGSTFASPKSYNNHWGVPLSLARMPQSTLYGIFEIGMNHPGETAPLAQLVCPHIGVITAIGEAHIGHMGSKEVIAKEKADIFTSKPSASFAILNQDNAEVDIISTKARESGVSRVLYFGKSAHANARLIHYTPDVTGLKGNVTVNLRGQELHYTLAQPGEHLAMNSLIPLIIGEVLGLDQGRLIQQMETFFTPEGRGNHHRISVAGGDFLLIDDTYNANLSSLKAGLATLAGIPVPGKGRRLAILGEMLELGDQALSQHQLLMEEVLRRPIDQVFVIGGPAIEKAWREKIPSERAGRYRERAEDLIPFLHNFVRAGDILFIKGSSKSRVNIIVNSFLNPVCPGDRGTG